MRSGCGCEQVANYRETVRRYDKAKMSIVRVGVVQGAMIEHRKRTDGQMGQGIMGTPKNKGECLRTKLLSLLERGASQRMVAIMVGAS